MSQHEPQHEHIVVLARMVVEQTGRSLVLCRCNQCDLDWWE